jgi:2-desacetyl-2-hydroxyethyl bacteriochlorophyllide A dehydrogenase
MAERAMRVGRDRFQGEWQMKAMMCVEPGKLVLVEDRPLPVARPGEIAVDIFAIGVCGTDFHIFEGTHPYVPYPLVLGHELSGVVAEGSGNARLPAGTPVVINPYVHCGQCIACRKGRFNCCVSLRVVGVHGDGGMADRLVMPEENLYPAGDLGLRNAAMVEFLSIGAHGVRRSELQKGERALVVGAGPIGLGVALFAREAGGAVTIMDISDKRIAFARDKLGFTSFIKAGPEALAEAGAKTGGDLFDVVFDATGNARAMEGSFAFVAHTGTLVFVGVLNATISFSDPEFHKREMKVVSTRNALAADFEHVMAAMRAGKIPTDAINTHTIAMHELPEAMPAWLKSDTPPVKAIVMV